MRLRLGQARDAIRYLGHHLGLAFMFLGIFLERPVMFAMSILVLLIVTPLREVGRRAWQLKIELLVIGGLISGQVTADSQFNALILTIYLMGMLNGLVLPDPRAIPPRSWLYLAVLCLLLALFFTSSLPAELGLQAEQSAFGTNPEDYQIDPRSLTYAVFIVTLYLAPHFAGVGSPLHAGLLLGTAMLGANKFGMLFGALYRLTPRLVAPSILLVFVVLTVVGVSTLEFTAARAALWSDFFSNFPDCMSIHGVCTELIAINNEEGVRSFHSILLDFAWYGGFAGLSGGLYFLLRVARVRSRFGMSSGILFAVALLFGFPPFFNERHVLIVYALLILFQKGRACRLAHRPLRAHCTVPVSGRGAAPLSRS